MAKPAKTKFSDITRDIFNLSDDVDVGAMEDDLASASRSRRGSATLSETMFKQFLIRNSIPLLFEVGGNNGRHTKSFLMETRCDIHVFEPNTAAIPFFSDLVGNPRIKLNFFGLSDSSKLAPFRIIRSIDGKQLDAINGISSFEKLEGHELTYMINAAAVASGKEYIDIQFEGNVPDYGLWIDVEGHAPEVVRGFGPALEQAAVCMCEVEYRSLKRGVEMFGSKETADLVVDTLLEAGHKIIYRDFQNLGQCNIISLGPKYISETPHCLIEAREFIESVSKKYQIKPSVGV